MKLRSPKPSPRISKKAEIGKNVLIWAGSQVREYANIGEGSSIGQYAYIGPGVVIGRNCKIQNHALIYEPAKLGDAVFIGPNVVITNDLHPRAVGATGEPKSKADWQENAAFIEEGASIGASATLVGSIRIGSWSMVAAGAVVIQNVPSFALVAGVPAKQIGWVGRSGKKLNQFGSRFVCPDSGEEYEVMEPDKLVPVR